MRRRYGWHPRLHRGFWIAGREGPLCLDSDHRMFSLFMVAVYSKYACGSTEKTIHSIAVHLSLSFALSSSKESKTSVSACRTSFWLRKAPHLVFALLSQRPNDFRNSLCGSLNAWFKPTSCVESISECVSIRMKNSSV